MTVDGREMTKTKDSHEVDNGFKEGTFVFPEAIRSVLNGGFIGIRCTGAWKGQSRSLIIRDGGSRGVTFVFAITLVRSVTTYTHTHSCV